MQLHCLRIFWLCLVDFPQLQCALSALSLREDEPLDEGLDVGLVEELADVRSKAALLMEQLVDQRLQVVGVARGDGVDFVSDDFEDQTEQVISSEGVLQHAEFIEQTTEASDVRLVGVGLVFTDFRRHVVWSSHYSGRHFPRYFQHFTDAEVPELDCVVSGQVDVRSFDVSMEDFVGVDVLQCKADLDKSV